MKILVLCAFGKNRSRHLAGYLKSLGYDTDFAGTIQNTESTQDKINEADILITVHPSVFNALEHNFYSEGKRIIKLDIEDRPEMLLSSKERLDGQNWINFQERFVYPEIEKQINEYLPFE